LAGIRFLFFRLVRVLSVYDENFPDLLHFLRRQLLADLLHPQRSIVPIIGRRLDLDELMRVQRAIDLGQDRVREAVLVTDDDDGVEVVRLGPQFAAT
jgi:hypothetical protein